MSQNLQEMSNEELEELAVNLKNQEQDYLAQIKEAKVQVRDEINRRARISYATQKLDSLGIKITPETLHAVMEAE